MTPRPVVSLIGLPGAGKTTLARGLAERLGWEWVSVGEILRRQAQDNRDLREALARGELAAEDIVERVVRDAIQNRERDGLILDGFPRHSKQLPIARDLFQNWRVLLLDVGRHQAQSRLARRRSCPKCGYTDPGSEPSATCPICGAIDWVSRPEDADSVLATRIAESEQRLNCLVSDLDKYVRLDATAAPIQVLEAAVKKLLGIYTDQSSSRNSRGTTLIESAPFLRPY